LSVFVNLTDQGADPMKTAITTAFALLAMTAAAYAAPVMTVSTDKGDVLAGENGMTLYTFKKDTSGVSNCYDKCAANWPPLAAEGDAMAEGAYSIVERKDGSKQWAKDGMPLYFWIKDAAKGDTTGDGVLGVWDLARP
jgi:predicted lipoprotein with Yx(FWY)xxD motif